MLRRFPLTSVLRTLFSLTVIAIGCGAPHSGKIDEAFGTVAEAVSFSGIGDPTKIVPGVKCVTNDALTGHFIAVFSAQNPTSATIVVPLGTSNAMSQPPSQPTSFAPGTQYFSVGFPVGTSIKWTI